VLALGVLVGGLLAMANIAVTRAIWRDEGLEPGRKRALTLLLWAVPGSCVTFWFGDNLFRRKRDDLLGVAPSPSNDGSVLLVTGIDATANHGGGHDGGHGGFDGGAGSRGHH
jgi:hypothetical protein